eukprot:scaffold467_cov403-Prasinococcus_capsulatus_cf.AAC.2
MIGCHWTYDNLGTPVRPLAVIRPRPSCQEGVHGRGACHAVCRAHVQPGLDLAMDFSGTTNG